MASFNQSPLGQTSLALQSTSLTLGNGEGTLLTQTNFTKYAFDNSGNGETISFESSSAIVPPRRRAIKNVRAV